MNIITILKDKGRNVETAGPDTALHQVVERLASKKIGCLVVTETSGEVCGIVSERDVVKTLAELGPAALDQPVRKVMTTAVITCSEAETIEEIMSKMTTGRFRHIPVVENGKLVGLVSIGDVVKLRIAEALMEAEAMRAYIATG